MTRYNDKLQPRLYRARDGIFLGVCMGLARYFNFRVLWIRLILIFLFIVSGFWPVAILYCIASLVIKPEPARPIETQEEQDFYDSYVSSRHRTLQRLSRRFQALERRIQRLEHSVTTREFDWDRKLNG